MFNKPVTVVKIGYGYYDRNTGQESIIQWINVGKRGQTFQWNLGNSNYNVTYVVVDLGRGVYKVYRWRYYQVNLTSGMGAGAPHPASYEAYVRVSSNNAFVGWQIKSSVDSVNGTGSTEGVTLKISKPGEVIYASILQNPPGYLCTINSTTTQAWPYQVYDYKIDCKPTTITVRVFSDYQASWQIKSSVDSVSGTGSATRTLSFKNGENITASITSNPSGYLCSISPTSLQPAPYNVYNFTVSCTPWATVRVFSDYQASWQIKSSVDSVNGTGSTEGVTLRFIIGENITASITSNPYGWLCSISPTSLQPAPGGSYDFRISCTPWATVRVFSDYQASWQIKSSVDSVSGTGSTTVTLKISKPGEVIYASILQIPPGYQECTVNPSSVQVNPGGVYDFRIGCTAYIYARVFSDYPDVAWELWTPASHIIGSGSTTVTLKISKPGDWLYATINWSPVYDCVIGPANQLVYPGGVYDLTVTCWLPWVDVYVWSQRPDVSWTITSSIDSISGTGPHTQEPPLRLYIKGYYDKITASITSNPPGYQCIITPTSYNAAYRYSIYDFWIDC
jgi:hypothetical protein